MDADAAPAARRIAVAADVAAVADARAFPEEPSAPRPAAGRRTPVRCSGCGSYAGSVAFGRDESARVDDSGAEAPARRPVVPGTDVVAFVQRAGGAFGQVKRRDDGRIRRVGKERVRGRSRGARCCARRDCALPAARFASRPMLPFPRGRRRAPDRPMQRKSLPVPRIPPRACPP